MGTGYQQRILQPPVGEILDTASLELRELQGRLRQLTQRIRTLRRALVVLQDLQSACGTQPQPTSKSSAEGNSSSLECQDVVFQRDPALRRACRIALLEATEEISEEEILERINRRGSYSFPDQASARVAIASELEAMSKTREAARVRDSSGSKWRRAESELDVAAECKDSEFPS